MDVSWDLDGLMFLLFRTDWWGGVSLEWFYMGLLFGLVGVFVVCVNFTFGWTVGLGGLAGAYCYCMVAGFVVF